MSTRAKALFSPFRGNAWYSRRRFEESQAHTGASTIGSKANTVNLAFTSRHWSCDANCSVSQPLIVRSKSATYLTHTLAASDIRVSDMAVRVENMRTFKVDSWSSHATTSIIFKYRVYSIEHCVSYLPYTATFNLDYCSIVVAIYGMIYEREETHDPYREDV